jgi:glycosyltransferase involved in cell wall biosynthesis
MTYLYATTTSLLPLTTGRLPTILQPTAHDEPALWVRLFDSIFRLPDAFLFFTPEERATVARRFAMDPAGLVAGIGMDAHPRADAADVRRRLGLGDAPYLIYVGRIDPAKGVGEAFHFFETYKRRNPGPLRLVLVGESVMDLAPHPEVVLAGFLDESDKRAALAGALALIQPSYFESFSIVLCESWLQGRPALVQNGSAVLRGQAHRSGGAVPYTGFAQFEAAVDLLLDAPSVADHMGESGRRYAVDLYGWDRVIGVVEQTVELARRRFTERAHQPWTAAYMHARSSTHVDHTAIHRR